MRPRLLVVQPDPEAGLDRFETWLGECGVECVVVLPFAGVPVPSTLDTDGLLVLGGAMSASDDDQHPWLTDLRSLIRDAAHSGRPVLGICLGAQLLAQALGGEVGPGDRGTEAGAIYLAWRQDEVGDDALFADLPKEFLTGAFHKDMISRLPDGAVPLARSELYEYQAFRCGARAWGVQFHPELSSEQYAVWVDTHGDPNDRDGTRSALAGFELRDDQVEKSNRILAERFSRVLWEYTDPRGSRT